MLLCDCEIWSVSSTVIRRIEAAEIWILSIRKILSTSRTWRSRNFV